MPGAEVALQAGAKLLVFLLETALFLPSELMPVRASHQGTVLPASAQRITRGGTTLVLTQGDEVPNLGQMPRADHRSNGAGHIQRVAQADAHGAGGKLGAEVGMDAFLHQDA